MTSKLLNVPVPVAETPLRNVWSYLHSDRITRHVTLNPEVAVHPGGAPVDAVTHAGWGRGYARLKRVGIAGVAVAEAAVYGYVAAELALDTLWLGLAAGAIGGITGAVGWALRRNVTPVSGAVAAYTMTTKAVGVPARAFLRGVAVAGGALLDGSTWIVSRGATLLDRAERAHQVRRSAGVPFTSPPAETPPAPSLGA